MTRRTFDRHDVLHGLSVIEVLVAMGIIGLLMALLLPAVQSSREVARRIACGSQLRQLALAFANYDSTYGVFPRSGWSHQLRSYLEQPKGYEAIPLLACPSDTQHADGDALRGGLSYLMNDGLGTGIHNGVRARRGVLSSRDVTDGMSMTAAFAERLALPWFAPSLVDWQQHPHLWNRVIRRIYVSTDDLDEFVDQCRHHAGAPHASYLLSGSYDHIMGPNENSCEVFPQAPGPIIGHRWAVTASSPHPGGTHVATVDGALRFVSEHIALQVWRAIGTRNGGELEANNAF